MVRSSSRSHPADAPGFSRIQTDRFTVHDVVSPSHSGDDGEEDDAEGAAVDAFSSAGSVVRTHSSGAALAGLSGLRAVQNAETAQEDVGVPRGSAVPSRVTSSVDDDGHAAAAGDS